MWRLITDENFNGDILRGVLFRKPDSDIVRTQDVGLKHTDDPLVLEWAAEHGRIVLTHDRATMPDFAYQRVLADKRMPGLFVVNDRIPIHQAIEEIFLLMTCSEQEEWEGKVLYLPL